MLDGDSLILIRNDTNFWSGYWVGGWVEGGVEPWGWGVGQLSRYSGLFPYYLGKGSLICTFISTTRKSSLIDMITEC